MGYGLVRYVRGAAERSAQLRERERAQVSFNYLGQFDQLFTENSMDGGRGVERSGGMWEESEDIYRCQRDDHGGEIAGDVGVCSEGMYRGETMEVLARGYVAGSWRS